MIVEYQKFRMEDQDKTNHFFIEVNWKPEDELTNNCKILKITFPDDKVCYLKKEYLNAMLFAIGTEEEQRQLIPQKIITTKSFESTLRLKATKNIEKGQEIIARVKFSVPDQEKEIIGSIRLDHELGKNKIIRT